MQTTSTTLQVNVIKSEFVSKAVNHFLSVMNKDLTIPTIMLDLNDAEQTAKILIIDTQELELSGNRVYNFAAYTTYQALCETYNYQCLNGDLHVPDDWYEVQTFDDEF